MVANIPGNSKPMVVSTPSSKQRFDGVSMSPMTKTERWLHGPTPKTETYDALLHKTKTGQINKHVATSTKRLDQKVKSRWSIPFISRLFFAAPEQECGQDLEGDTLVEEQSEVSSVKTKGYRLVEEEKEDTKAALDSYKERSLEQSTSASTTWTDDEEWVFEKLSKLGHEPLLPASWQLDFPSFPDVLFSENIERTFVNNTHSSIPHAANALNNLIQAGTRCRDRVQAKQSPERPLDREIRAYIKWSLLDGQIQHKTYIPLIAVATAKPDESVEGVVLRITKKLHKRGSQYRNKWRLSNFKPTEPGREYTHEMPTLYGLVVKHSIVAIVTSDSSVPEKPIRTLKILDFQKVGHDVWQALSIAVIVIKARNYLRQLEQEQELGEKITDESDPDA